MNSGKSGYSPVFCLLLSLLSADTAVSAESGIEGECVILLHGLARTSRSMNTMEKMLRAAGYEVVNTDYPSRKHSIETLSKQFIPPALDQCHNIRVGKIHFVTHSMGGILLRWYLSGNEINKLGRVVMLSPPNQGSEVVDKLKHLPGYSLLNGPAGHQLGTDEASMPSRLGAADFEVGVITGESSINFFLSMLIPGDDDGKVSVERAKLQGMKEFLIVPYSHPFIMKRKAVIHEVIHFLRAGSFN